MGAFSVLLLATVSICKRSMLRIRGVICSNKMCLILIVSVRVGCCFYVFYVLFGPTGHKCYSDDITSKLLFLIYKHCDKNTDLVQKRFSYFVCLLRFVRKYNLYSYGEGKNRFQLRKFYNRFLYEISICSQSSVFLTQI